MVRVKKKGGFRKGRGYSIREVLEAGLTIEEARSMGFRIDRRRKSLHESNVKELEELKKWHITEKAKEKKKPPKKLVPLIEVKGIGQKTIKKLEKAGITSANALVDEDPEKISKKTGLSKKIVERYISEAKKVI